MRESDKNKKNIQELKFGIARKKVITHFSVKSHPKYEQKRVRNLIKQIEIMEVESMLMNMVIIIYENQNV